MQTLTEFIAFNSDGTASAHGEARPNLALYEPVSVISRDRETESVHLRAILPHCAPTPYGTSTIPTVRYDYEDRKPKPYRTPPCTDPAPFPFRTVQIRYDTVIKIVTQNPCRIPEHTDHHAGLRTVPIQYEYDSDGTAT